MADATAANHHYTLVIGAGFHRRLDSAAHLNGALHLDEGIDTRSQIDWNRANLLALGAHRFDDELVGNRHGVVYCESAPHRPVKAILFTMLGNETGQFLVVRNQTPAQPRQRINRTVHITSSNQVLRQAASTKQHVVVCTNHHHTADIQYRQTLRAGSKSAPHTLGYCFLWRIGRNEHHRIVRHQKATNNCSHSQSLVYCLRAAENTGSVALDSGRSAFM